MRNFKSRIGLLALAIVANLTVTTVSQACFFFQPIEARPPASDTAIKNADMVFIAEITEAKQIWPEHKTRYAPDTQRLTIIVRKAIKGTKPGETFIVERSYDSAACTYALVVGQTYTVLAAKPDEDKTLIFPSFYRTNDPDYPSLAWP